MPERSPAADKAIADLDQFLRSDPESASPLILRNLFIATAEMQSDLELHTKVLGAIAGRLGITADQLRATARGHDGA